MIRTFALLTAFLAVPGAANAVTVTLQLRPRAEGIDGRPVTLRIRQVERPSDIERDGAALERSARVGESLTAELSPGFWSVELESPSIWTNRQIIAITASATHMIDVWPSGAVHGVVASSGGTPLKSVSIFFARVSERTDGLDKGDVACLVGDDGKYHCVLPVGTFDLRLHARSHVSRFFWNQIITADAPTDLGKSILKEGQAVFGRVEAPHATKIDLSKAVVQARPPAMGEGVQPLVSGGAMLVLSGAARSDGSFQIDGLPPGPYTLSAHHPAKLYSDPVRITVSPGSEIQLFQPLRLAAPRQLSMSITPPADDAGQPWRVSVSRYVNVRYLETVTESNATAAGFWSSPPLQPGKFDVVVARRDGSVWYAETLEITQDTNLHVQLTATRAAGTATIGGKPLRATLRFQGRGGTAVAESDDNGKFTVLLPGPRDQKWDVTVNAQTPTVRKTVRQVPIRARDSGEDTVEIDVPALSISGVVVAEDGSPIPSALVNILKQDASESLMQTSAAQDGAFVLHGISSGRYSVRATAFLKESDEEAVNAADDDPPAPVRLVLRDVKKLRGIVQSDLGPVAGARVIAFPTDTAVSMASWRETDAQGLFEIWLPPNTNEFDVFVAPPGFTYTIDHMVWQEGKVLVEKVYQRGGTLIIPNAPDLQIVHDGGISSTNEIAREWSVHFKDNATAVIDMMEPGVYSLCRVDPSSRLLFRATNGRTGGRCAAGFLSPNGTLTLASPQAARVTSGDTQP